MNRVIRADINAPLSCTERVHLNERYNIETILCQDGVLFLLLWHCLIILFPSLLLNDFASGPESLLLLSPWNYPIYLTVGLAASVDGAPA